MGNNEGRLIQKALGEKIKNAGEKITGGEDRSNAKTSNYFYQSLQVSTFQYCNAAPTND